MKKFSVIKQNAIKKSSIINRPINFRENEFDFIDEDDDNYLNNWVVKAKKLQARRWRKLKHQEL